MIQSIAQRDTQGGQIAGAPAYDRVNAERGTHHAEEGESEADQEQPSNPPSETLGPWLTGNELLDLTKNAPDILIGGDEDGDGLLREQSKLVLGGGSKAGKTWCLLDMALAVAAGDKWLGRFKCNQGKVLYINLELQPWTAAARIQAIAAARGRTAKGGLKKDISDNLLTWNLRGICYDIDIMLSEARQKMNGDRDIKLIVIDPIYKAYASRDENAAGDMTDLMLQLENFAKECGAAIAFGAHFSKGNQSAKSAIDRISGSGVMARDPDAILTLTQHEQEDCYVLDAIVREFKPLPPVVLEWAYPIMSVRNDLDALKLKQAGPQTSRIDEKLTIMQEVLRKEGGSLPSGKLFEKCQKINLERNRENIQIGSWRQSVSRNQQRLQDFGIISRGDSTKEIIYDLKTDELRGAKS